MEKAKVKNVWIFNQYNMPPEYGHLNRHYNFGKFLKEAGYNPVVFVGSFLHNTDIQMIKNHDHYKVYDNCNFPYIFIRTCDYSKSKLKRVYAMFEYNRNLYKTVTDLEKPDVIIGSSAHPLAAIAAIKLAKKYKCKAVVEVRDLWPESFAAYNIISKRNPILKLLYAGEKWIYKKADKLIFTMEGGKDYIVKKRWDKSSGGPIDLSKVYHINNGVDLSVFDNNSEQYQIEDPDLDNENTFKVIYTGSIRMVNKVGFLLDAAKILREKGAENIKLLIWGDGDEKKRLQERVTEEELTNVCFKGRVDKKYIPYIASKGQLNIALGENMSLFDFGISANKMFEYFAAGKPVLFTIKSGYSIIDKYSTGIELSDSSAMSIADAILYFKNLSKDEYEKYCINAKKASHDYDFQKLTEKLIELIEL